MGRGLCPWPVEAEQLAAKKVKERSWKRPCGSLFSGLPEACFSRRCTYQLYTSGLVLIIVGAAGIGLGLPKMLTAGAKLTKTLCTTESAEIANEVLLCRTCNQSTSSCQVRYDCLELKVSYTAGSKHVSTFMRQDIDSLYEPRNCVVRVYYCPQSTPNMTVSDLQTRYGIPGTQFTCYYSTRHVTNVTYMAPSDTRVDTMTYLQVYGGAAAIGVGVLGYMLLCTVCGYYFHCSSSPPDDLQQELDQQRSLAGPQVWQSQGQTPGGVQSPFSSVIQQPTAPFGQHSNFNQRKFGFEGEQNVPPPPSYTSAVNY